MVSIPLIITREHRVTRSIAVHNDARADHGIGRVKTKPGAQLTAAQVKGITALVANAVEGLPENVTIVNQTVKFCFRAGPTGNGTDPSQPDALKMTQEQLLAKVRYESALQQSAINADDTLGNVTRSHAFHKDGFRRAID